MEEDAMASDVEASELEFIKPWLYMQERINENREQAFKEKKEVWLVLDKSRRSCCNPNGTITLYSETRVQTFDYQKFFYVLDYAKKLQKEKKSRCIAS
jgi:hypothetical protein